MKPSFESSSSEEMDVGIHLLSDQKSLFQDEACSIEDLLKLPTLEEGCVRAVISAGNESFLLYVTKVNEVSGYSLPDAVQALTEFVNANNCPSISIFYSLEQSNASDRATFLATCEICLPNNEMDDTDSEHTVSRAQGCFAESLSWSQVPVKNADLLVKRDKVSKIAAPWIRRPSALTSTRSRLVALFATIAALALVIYVVYRGGLNVPFRQHFENGIWVRYDTTDSEGPRYQLQFSRHNVSEWENPYAEGDWAVRIDDQAIIPASLMDEDELRYQRWFRQRYPQMREVVDNKDYLSKEFLSDPDRLKVPADWLFHPAHCILALRRYWKAKESGHHVCPRDIDHRHIHHCLDSLDEWFFIGGEMRKPPPEPTDYEAEWSLVWKTKVCW